LINFAESFGVLEEIALSEYPNQFIVFLDGSTADLRPLREEVEATIAPVAAETPTPAPVVAGIPGPAPVEALTPPEVTSAGVVSSTRIAWLVLAAVGVLLL
jgi:hypothetical protein